MIMPPKEGMVIGTMMSEHRLLEVNTGIKARIVCGTQSHQSRTDSPLGSLQNHLSVIGGCFSGPPSNQKNNSLTSR